MKTSTWRMRKNEVLMYEVSVRRYLGIARKAGVRLGLIFSSLC